MSTGSWPSYAAALRMAKQASNSGWLLKLEPHGGGWQWTWAHRDVGPTLVGQCSSPVKAVALVCALVGAPVFR
jgi:hypothetical protein